MGGRDDFAILRKNNPLDYLLNFKHRRSGYFEMKLDGNVILIIVLVGTLPKEVIVVPMDKYLLKSFDESAGTPPKGDVLCVFLINLFQLSVAFHIETRHLICFANQMTGFYMKSNKVAKRMAFLKSIHNSSLFIVLVDLNTSIFVFI